MGPASLAASFKASGATLTCLCASDKTYETEAAGAAAALKAAGAKHIYLAGKSGALEPGSQVGVDTFIYAGCDMLTALTAAHRLIAV